VFIQSILDEKISIFRKPKVTVNDILKKNKFPGCSNGKSIPCEDLPDFNKITNEYDYLIKLPIYTLTEEEIEKLKENKENLEKDFKELSNKTNKDMWKEELFFLKKMYKKMY
jgi:DNA topoisomerase-2